MSGQEAIVLYDRSLAPDSGLDSAAEVMGKKESTNKP